MTFVDLEPKKNPAVLAEQQKRELGDCNPDHLYCRSLGLKPGTDLYVQCRLQAMQIAAGACVGDARQPVANPCRGVPSLQGEHDDAKVRNFAV
jgi:hypothetical protein